MYYGQGQLSGCWSWSEWFVNSDTAFGRQLEYYTGMVFKIDIRSKSRIINCCNGGRYDKLVSDLGSKKQTPAVGAALNLIN